MAGVFHLFEIYFFGLINFHGEEDSERMTVARLLEDPPDHVPEIYLNGAKGERLTTDVQFGNVDVSSANVLRSFDKFVPHLAEVSKPSVKLNKNAAAQKVFLPAGRLATVENYRRQGIFELNGPIGEGRCIARINLLQARTVMPEVIVKFNNREERISSDGFVFFANREPNSRVLPRGRVKTRTIRHHFKKHHKATDGSEADVADLYELPAECTTMIINPPDVSPDDLQAIQSIVDSLSQIHAKEDLETRNLAKVLPIVLKFLVADHPECSNSQWP